MMMTEIGIWTDDSDVVWLKNNREVTNKKLSAILRYWVESEDFVCLYLEQKGHKKLCCSWWGFLLQLLHFLSPAVRINLTLNTMLTRQRFVQVGP